MDASTPQPASAQPENQREALRESERKATEQHPTTFRDESNEDKIVEIPPVGEDEKPIRGLDPH
jgi:FtsZ-interacting cell division protein YlmF